MFDYLKTYDGPVVEGLEKYEIVYAKNQPEYIPLPTLAGALGSSAVSRWTPTDEQRKAIADGADIYLENFHFGQPLSPVRMSVARPEGTMWKEWFAMQIEAPFASEVCANHVDAAVE